MELTTQDRILLTARKLFGENGFRGTTTAELARTAGVAEGTIYRYYKDKKELFIACVKPVIDEAVRRETALVEGLPPREALRRRIKERVRVMQEHLDVFTILITEGRNHPELASMLLSHMNNAIPESEWQAMADSVRRGIYKRPPNPLFMTVGLTAAIWAMVSVGPMSESIFSSWPIPLHYEHLEDEFADFVCSALLGEEME